MARRWNGVIARLNTPTGDGRIINSGGVSTRDLPLPLMWQRETDAGHAQSLTVGVIETLTIDNDMVSASGRLLNSAPFEVIEQLEAGVTGPSVDLDDVEYVFDEQAERVLVTRARVSGATMVAVPAFSDVWIELMPEPVEEPDMVMASAAPEVLPPMEAFARPAEVGPLTVSRETWGQRVSGYIATWGTCHVGMPGCTTAPSSTTDYAHFLRKEQRTSDSTTIPVGVLTVGGGHADTQLGYRPALEHYDNVGSAVAKVFAGEDEHGIWLSGWILPYADETKVSQLSDLDVSGDWRRIGGNMEMIAVCAVNTPGFPVLKKVAFSMDRGGQQTLIGQFKVEPVEAVDWESVTASRAKFAKLNWEGRL